MEPKYFLDAVFYQKSIYDIVSLLYLWLAKQPVFSMKYWHSWLLLKMQKKTPLSVINSNVNISWREQVDWPTKGTGGSQQHKCLIFDGKQHPKNIWFLIQLEFKSEKNNWDLENYRKSLKNSFFLHTQIFGRHMGHFQTLLDFNCCMIEQVKFQRYNVDIEMSEDRGEFAIRHSKVEFSWWTSMVMKKHHLLIIDIRLLWIQN